MNEFVKLIGLYFLLFNDSKAVYILRKHTMSKARGELFRVLVRDLERGSDVDWSLFSSTISASPSEIDPKRVRC